MADGQEAFLESELIQDAVLRRLQVMAESTQRLSEEMKHAHAEVDWKNIAGFRNLLVHDYFGVDLDRCWTVVESNLPGLKTAIAAMLGDQSRDP